MKVLVTGANGFIGSAVVEGLLQSGHEVIACARSPRNLPSSPQLSYVHADFTTDSGPEAWAPRLLGVSAVINCAGILREPRRGDFARVHDDGPMALLAACEAAGVGKFIQLSALGEAEDGEFIRSKHRFDDALLASGFPATVIRPSVVLSTRGSYGGTSLLRALAAAPGLVPLPGRGEQRVQPVLLEDLVELVLRCLAQRTAAGEVVYAVGPEVMTLRETLRTLRAWLKLPPARELHVPELLVRTGAWMGERFGAGPMGETVAGMLARGNVAPPGAWSRARELTGFATRPVPTALAMAPSFVQDRWHARLYLLRPLLWLSLVAVWLLSGLSGLAATPEQFGAVLGALGVAADWQRPLVVASSVVDLVLGLLLLLRVRVGAVLALMLISLLAYTLWLSVMAPALWLAPLGGMLKNLAVLLVLGAYWAVRDDR